MQQRKNDKKDMGLLESPPFSPRTSTTQWGWGLRLRKIAKPRPVSPRTPVKPPKVLHRRWGNLNVHQGLDRQRDWWWCFRSGIWGFARMGGSDFILVLLLFPFFHNGTFHPQNINQKSNCRRNATTFYLTEIVHMTFIRSVPVTKDFWKRSEIVG